MSDYSKEYAMGNNNSTGGTQENLLQPGHISSERASWLNWFLSPELGGLLYMVSL